MAVLTPQQTTAIDTKLSVSLPTLSDDKIIELCLLQRAAPEVKPAFVEALNTEITRRFTAAEIAANDVMFSVIQNFANQFTSGVPFFAKKMLEMSASVNRDIWFSNNSSMFAEAIEDETLLAWLVTQPDVVTKILNNTLGLTAIAKSAKASSAILSNAETVTILKAATNVWQIATGQSKFMDVLLLSNELMTYVANNSTAMTAVAASSVAMTAITSSSAAMAIIATSSVALSAIVKSATARTILESDSAILKGVRTTIYATIKASWTKSVGISQTAAAGTVITTINSAVASPAGFCIATLGYVSIGYSDAVVVVTKANGVQETYPTTSLNPTSITSSYFIGFNGAKLTCGSVYNRDCSVYVELWIPPAI